jgi:uncharacterized protein YoxC
VEGYLEYILIVVTFLLLVQAAVFVGIYLLARRAIGVIQHMANLQERAEYVLSSVEPILKTTNGLISELREASTYVAQGAEHINAITEMARDQAADIKDLMGDSTAIARREMERTRDRVEQVQRTLASASDNFEKTTYMVQQSVLEPAREFSYIMFGIRRALETLMAGNRLPVNRVYQDEEMFI